jgi:hypothetical protein
MKEYTVYRGVQDLSPNQLSEFFISQSSNNSYGDGMYFSYQYSFAEIFAKGYGRKSFSLIGEYQVIPAGNGLTVTESNKNKITYLDENIQSLYKKKDNNNFSVDDYKSIKSQIQLFDYVDHIGRELVVRKYKEINLINFSILMVDDLATELFNVILDGELVSSCEIKGISVEKAGIVHKFLKEKELL